MRNWSLFFAFVFLLMFSSCKKDWTCQCEPTENAPSHFEVMHYPIDGKTPSEAKEACFEYNDEDFDCFLP